jgi:UDP-N-acetylmuramoyl-tripeptide--D-alanyl-D-alanine ligase
MAQYSPSTIKAVFHKTRRFLAKNWVKVINPYIIGITGSQGKTTTTHILKNIIENPIVTDTNLDTLYNVPITALKFNPWRKIGIFELGIDKRGEMDLHLEIIKPNIAIVTGISAVHSDAEHLGSVANTIIEKGKLVKNLPEDGYAILNWDDENVRGMAKLTKAKIIYFGTDKRNCQIYFDPKSINISLKGTSGKIYDEGSEININTDLIGKHQFYNIASAYAAYKILYSTKFNHSKERIISTFAMKLLQVEALKGRLNLEKGPMNTIILNDSLRANPTSTKAGLEIMADIQIKKGRKIAVLGEMGELGDLSEIEHRNIGDIIAKTNPDLFIGIGPLHRFSIENAFKNGFGKDKTVLVNNPIAAAKILKKFLEAGDIIYLKASLMRHLERLVMELNHEEVNCEVSSCPFYNQCQNCKYRYTGYAIPKSDLTHGSK